MINTTNLNFVLMAKERWEVESVHTGLVVGTVQYNPGWRAFSFKPETWQLDSAALREIAKFLDDQEQIRRG